MTPKQKKIDIAKHCLLGLIAWMLMLVIQGAIPMLLTPTLGQATWSTGFSQSYANQQIWSIFAVNFGAPTPAAIAFGLPGAWLTGIFLRLGISAPDAYSAMVACWMSLSMLGAYLLCRHFSVGRSISVLASLLWMSMPIIWAHAAYSMLSIGIALLPSYYLCTFKLIEAFETNNHTQVKSRFHLTALAYLIASTLAIFMDGYSFMFFATGSTILLAWRWWYAYPQIHRKFLVLGIGIHIGSLVFAYALYGAFIGKAGFEGSSMDFFRSWGVDVLFWLQPTAGIHWLPDILGMSQVRSGSILYGDSSTWITTFTLPILITAIFCAWRAFHTHWTIPAFLIVLFFGLYMALGPAIKFNAKKELGIEHGQLMPESKAIAKTGSSLISSNLPGFKNMRASYRWTALGVFFSWMLILVSATDRSRGIKKSAVVILMLVVLAMNFPNLEKKIASNSNSRTSFLNIENDLIMDLRHELKKGERVAFLPWNNDFLGNYISAKLEITAFNIGGDKNLDIAKESWPKRLKQFPMNDIDPGFTERVAMLLLDRETDAVVLTYLDLLDAAHNWPPQLIWKDRLQPTIRILAETSLFDVTTGAYQATVRLKQTSSNIDVADLRGRMAALSCAHEKCPFKNMFPLDGWSGAESWGRWSDGAEALAAVHLPSATASDLSVKITAIPFLVENQHTQQTVDVLFDDSLVARLSYKLPQDQGQVNRSFRIPSSLVSARLERKSEWGVLRFRFHDSISPAQLKLSTDQRRLSLGLISFDVQPATH